ncbi:MAG: hypothetical protein O9311_13180 [Cytophagales bacterium]|jgi:hypothetical protein|nr:hypothetical protein [Cytophagales bacterium]
MKVKVLTIFICFVVFSCSDKSKKKDFAVENFNKHASKAFEIDSLISQSKFLTDYEKCVISKVIKNELDSVGDPEIILFPPYAVRHYCIEEIEFNFSFLLNEVGKIQLVCLPKLSYIYQDYDSFYSEKPDGKYYLKNPVEIIPLENINLSKIIDVVEYNNMSDRKKIKKMHEVVRMLTYLYRPDFNNMVSIIDFNNYIQDLMSNKQINRDTFDSIQRSIKNMDFNNGFLVYFSNNLGYLLIEYDLRNIDSFFVGLLPVVKKIRTVKTDSPKFDSCLD